MDVTGARLLPILERAAAGRSTPDQHVGTPREALHQRYGLTERELDILILIGTGLTNQQVADLEYLSINTVKSYIRTAYSKIGATSRSHAVLWVVTHGPDASPG